MTEHTYVLHPGKDTTTLAQRVQLFLSQAENMETQTLYTEDGATIIQGRVRNGGVKQLMGLDRTITVLITPPGGQRREGFILQGQVARQGRDRHGEHVRPLAAAADGLLRRFQAVPAAEEDYRRHRSLPGRINPYIQQKPRLPDHQSRGGASFCSGRTE